MKNHVAINRERQQMTQSELAQRVGVSRQTISSIEKGRYNPSLLLAYQLAQVFHCSIEELFDFKSEEKEVK